MERGDEIRRAVFQQLDGKEIFQVLFECHTGTQLCMLNYLQFSTDYDSCKTPKLPTSNA